MQVYTPRYICWWVSVTTWWQVSVCTTWWQSVCPSLHEQGILCADCMISQRGSCWWAWPKTSHSHIFQPHAGSPWSFCLFHPIPHSLSHVLSTSEHTTSVSLRCCFARSKNRKISPFFSFFWAISPPGLLVCDDPSSADLLLYASGRCDE
jgi:hypothetical protein